MLRVDREIRICIGIMIAYSAVESAENQAGVICPNHSVQVQKTPSIVGLQFKFHVLIGSFGFIAIYIILRSIGKYGGAYVGTRIGGAPRNVARYAGPALLPQAGVAIGLALQATESGVMAGRTSLVLNTILGSTIIFSPVLTEKTSKAAGEIQVSD